MKLDPMQWTQPRSSSAPPFTPKLTAWAVYLAMAGTTLPATLAPRIADAQPVERNYDIPGGPLSGALARFAAEAGVMLSADARLTEGKSTGGLKGRYGVQEGLNALLKGSGLAARAGSTGYVLETVAPGDESTLPEVSVTGAADPFEPAPEVHGIKADNQNSATKSSLPIRETPQAISAITRESMDLRQTRDVTSALELAAGVAGGRSGHGGPFAGRGLGTGENFNMRGQDLSENRDVKVDGFAVSSSMFDTAAYERVEAVKGPSSMLYGQGSLGGFINMVRKKPQAERRANVAGTLASFETRRVEGDATGALNEDGSLLGRFTAAFDDAGSFTDGVQTQTAMIGPSLEARFGERTRALMQVLYQEDRYIPSQGTPLKVAGERAFAPNIPREKFIGVSSREKSTAENLLTTLQVDHELGDRWLGTLALEYGHEDMRRFFDNYGYDFYGLQSGNVNLTADRAHIQNENWAGELRLEGRFDAFGREHRLLVGLEQNRRKNRTAFGYMSLGTANIYTGDFSAFGSPGLASKLDFDQDDSTISRNQGVYGQLILGVTDRAKLIAGLRHDRTKQQSRDNHVDGGALIDENNKKANTVNVGVTYDFTQNITGYARYAESFNPVDAMSISGEILDPEEGKSYELGVKTEWFGKRLAASAAVFRQDLDNVPIPDPTNNNFSVSGGLQRTKGIELELSGSPADGLTVGAAAAWFDSKYMDPADPNFGLTPYAAYNRTAALFASYEFQGPELHGFGWGATLVMVGKQSLSDSFNSASFGTATNDLFLDGYERLDMNFFYNGLDKWKFALQLRNVTDKVYIERVRDVSGSNYFGSPRAALFRAEYRFF